MTTPPSDVPHGTVAGYHRGCVLIRDCPATPTCAEAAREIDRRLGLDDDKLIPLAAITPHLLRLVAAAGGNARLVAQVCGVGEQTLRAAYRRNVEFMRRDTARRILITTAAQVDRERRARDTVPVTHLHTQLVRSMHVQRWSTGWQAEQLGCDPATLEGFETGEITRIPADLHRALVRLGGRTEGKWGPDETVARRARADGWHPLTAYDHGHLILRSVPAADRPAAMQRDAQARLDALRLSLDGLVSGHVSPRVGLGCERIKQLRAAAGLRFRAVGSIRSGAAHAQLCPGYEERARQVRRILDAHAADPSSDPLEVATRLGLVGNRSPDEISAAA